MFMPPLKAYSVILGVKIIIIRIIFWENYTLNNYLLYTSDRLFRQSERNAGAVLDITVIYICNKASISFIRDS